MSTTKQKASAVLNEKNTKLLPQNIKRGVTIFGVTGTHSGGSSATTIEELMYNIDDTKQINVSYEVNAVQKYLTRLNEYINPDTTRERRQEILSEGYLPWIVWYLYHYNKENDRFEYYMNFGLFAAGRDYLDNANALTSMLEEGGFQGDAYKYVTENLFAYKSNAPDISDIGYQEDIMYVTEDAKDALDTYVENNPDIITMDDSEFGCEGWYKVIISYSNSISGEHTEISFSEDLTLSLNCDELISPFEYYEFAGTGQALNVHADDDDYIRSTEKDLTTFNIGSDVPSPLQPLVGYRQFINAVEDVIGDSAAITITPFTSQVTEYECSYINEPGMLPTGFTHITLVKPVEVQGEVSFEEIVEPIELDNPSEVLHDPHEPSIEFYKFTWTLPLTQSPRDTLVAWKTHEGEISVQPYDWYEYNILDTMSMQINPQQQQN